ncbi:MAG: SMP-30/gluconolactonase/LRE family protein, partial [Proteobacteria bacterium]|nr:SMP-30/gluconolactonase/LRE family protein [Pseudomonadota bacterium]
MAMNELTPILDGLTFAEGPRWRDGRLWFSDFYAFEVIAVDLEGNRETIVTVPEQPSGLGWTPDGKLLIVSMRDQKLMRLENDALVEHADLSGHANYWCNDMVVDAQGGAYVGNFGFNRHAGEEPRATTLVRVSPDGTASVAADGLWFPNGTVITPDGKTLIVGETRAKRLTAFTVAADGSLSDRRVFAETDNMYPDGICLDAEGAVWVSDPQNKELVRFRDGGEVTDRISLGDRGAYACILGGEDRRTLFVCTNIGSGPEIAKGRTGKIEITRVDVPGAGL